MGSTNNWQVTESFRKKISGIVAESKVNPSNNNPTLGKPISVGDSTGMSPGNVYSAANTDYDNPEYVVSTSITQNNSSASPMDDPVVPTAEEEQANQEQQETIQNINNMTFEGAKGGGWGDPIKAANAAEAAAAGAATGSTETIVVKEPNQKIWLTQGNTYTHDGKDYKMEKGLSTNLNLKQNPHLEKMLGFMELQKTNHSKLTDIEKKSGVFDTLSFQSIKPQGKPGEREFTITDHIDSQNTRTAFYNIGKNTSVDGFQAALDIQSFDKFQNHEQKKWSKYVAGGSVTQKHFDNLANISTFNKTLSKQEKLKMEKDLKKKDAKYRQAIGGQGTGMNSYKWGAMQGEPTAAQKIEQKLMLGQTLSPKEQRKLNVLKGTFGVGQSNPAADWKDFY